MFGEAFHTEQVGSRVFRRPACYNGKLADEAFSFPCASTETAGGERP